MSGSLINLPDYACFKCSCFALQFGFGFSTCFRSRLYWLFTLFYKVTGLKFLMYIPDVFSSVDLVMAYMDLAYICALVLVTCNVPDCWLQ